jgi:hypothetical protein
VFGIILPALGIQLLIGNGYYTYLARRLARRENRTDVCAMPYGPSVPHMFIVTFVIMLPIFLTTRDPIRAWEAGLAWSFIIGLIVLIGAFVSPYIRRFTPRAALLGTLAGLSIAFISMRPAAQMWQALWIALPVFAIIVIGFFTGRKLPAISRSGWLRCWSAPRSAGSAVTCPPRMSSRLSETLPSLCQHSTSVGWATACRRSRRCWPPRSRWASTTSARA